jgi:hypothetical protein
MATLVWDQVGERIYQTGVDHGVLYLHDGTVAAWNGLTEVEESTVSELKSFHLDGVKFLENLIPGDFSGKLKALTYPDEFDAVNGIAKVGSAPGLAYYDQPSKSFSLSYRTRVGDDIEGIDHAYKIHILYNVVANPDSYSFSTLKDSVEPIEFGWALSGTPVKFPDFGFRPTVHISIDSTETPPDILKMLEDMLYGTDTTPPRLPSIQEIAEFFGYLGALLIVDHGGGTWSAVDESDTYITMIDSTTFQIDDADATYLDSDTYKVSSTNIGEEI